MRKQTQTKQKVDMKLKLCAMHLPAFPNKIK